MTYLPSTVCAPSSSPGPCARSTHQPRFHSQLSRFSRLPLPLSNVGSPARYAQAVRLLSQIASAWAQPSSIWLSLDFEAESRLPENAPLGLARASDFGFRRTSWDVDGNRSERCGLWIDLTVKWPEDEQQEWEKNRFVRTGQNHPRTGAYMRRSLPYRTEFLSRRRHHVPRRRA